MRNSIRLRNILLIITILCCLGMDRHTSSFAAGQQPDAIPYNEITRVSEANDGTEGNAKSEKPAISDDGQRIVFQSNADNLVSDELEGDLGIFYYNHQSGELRLIVSGTTTYWSRLSYYPTISGNGRYISYKTSQCYGPTVMSSYCESDLYLYDTDTDQRTTIDTGYTDNISGGNGVYDPSISYDGRFVAYQYHETFFNAQIYYKDMLLDITTTVSVDSIGTLGNGESSSPAISSNGRFVAFSSISSNLVINDTNGIRDVFLHDTQTGITTRVSVSSADIEGNGISSYPAISSDGRYIAFESAASNLVPDDNNDSKDIFVHDTQTGNTVRVSISSDGTESDSSSSSASISNDGQSITFSSTASNLVSGDFNGASDVFVHNLQTDQTHLVSGDNLGTLGNNNSTAPAISGDAMYVAFSSLADNLVSGDTNGVGDVFLRNQTSIDITFTDVFPTHWAFSFIEAIADAGLTSGYPDGTYRPENPVTRAEMAVFLINALGISPGPLPGSPSLSDISGHWAEAYIEELKDQGITGGYPDGTYRPENLVTRAEMAVFLLNALGISPPLMDGSHPFTDIGGHWAESFIEELFDQGMTGGYPDGTYRPENQVTRAEMAVFLVNTFGIALP